MHTIELRLCTPTGGSGSVEAVCQNLLADADVGGLVWNGRDVTDRRALEDELSHQARHDPLTGLPNRVLLLDRLRERAAPTADAARSSVILVDLDGFKNVNDTLGHPAGDELLQVAAQRLLGCVREGDTAARLGGDEFAVVARGGPGAGAVAVGRRIVDVLRQPFTVAGQEVRIGASIGIAYTAAARTAEDLLRDADIAMYVAKNTGKGRVEVFEPAMRVPGRRTAPACSRSWPARWSSGEIEVHFQPIIDLKHAPPASAGGARPVAAPGRLAGARRRVHADRRGDRGDHGDRAGGAAPGLPRRAALAATVPDRGHLGVAVNVSVHQVLAGRLVDHVVEALRDSGLPPLDAHPGDHRERGAGGLGPGGGRVRPAAARSACGSRSTTSAPATRRSAS